MLAQRFGSTIHLLTVQTPTEYMNALEAGPYAMAASQRDIQTELSGIAQRLSREGIQSDAVRRVGNVSELVSGYAMELEPDMLLFGAYGLGKVDRLRLGSTAEHLLRTARCPAIVVGPRALPKEAEAAPFKHILCATTSLDSPDEIVFFAGRLAAQMGAHLELLHAVDPMDRDQPVHQHEQRCERWSEALRKQNIPMS
jgi:nucleotide-binding universal stress UspA family protein